MLLSAGTDSSTSWWVENGTADAAPLANQLDRDLELLRRSVPALTITPQVVVAGTARLVEEAIAEELPGAEDRYSRLDPADLTGNIQGAEAGYSAVRPILTVRDAALIPILDGQFSAIDRTIAKYRTPAGYRLYTGLGAADRARLQPQLSALAETISQLSVLFKRWEGFCTIPDSTVVRTEGR